ncbi:MAG: HEAT repeat domain-containing protein [Gemmataceae bacterium]
MHRIFGTLLFAVVLLLAGDRTAWAQQFIFMNGGAVLAMDNDFDGSFTAPAAGSPSRGDESLLRSVGITADGPSLLAYFRVRSRGEAKPEHLTALIEQMGDKSPLAARKAASELAALGALAIPALRQAVKDPDRQQIARLAQRCLHALEQQPGQLSSAAARLIAQRRPQGAAEALLEFLPQAEDEGVIEEIRLALAAVAAPSGVGDKEAAPNAALLKALQDDSPIRRALAIDTLCHNGVTASVLRHVPLKKLLHDPHPPVRLRAALALARGRDPKAVSTLITLLIELPLNNARQAEEFLTEMAGDQAPKTALSNDDGARQKCRDAWATWWQASEDDTRLLDEVRKRTVTEAVRQKCANLIVKLGDADFTVRQKAQAEVKAMGSLIVPLLRQAARDRDLEIRNRARDCLSEMERDKNIPLSSITARLIALRKPVGAAETLLAYVPYCDDESSLSEVQLALNAVAIQNGKPDAAVVRSLSDAQGTRRAAAAEALCLGGDRTHLPAVRKLLLDSEPAVRLKAALALAGTGQRDAVPTLIDLLAELPSDRAEPADEYLQRLAGDGAPRNLANGDDSAARKKRQQAWAAWWKANGNRVALVDRYPPEGAERYLGHILLVIANTGQIMELGPDRKVRWQLNNLENPQDVQVLGTDRILIAEWNGQRVTERNRKGDVIWEKKTPNGFPLGVQRLRNGHTFIACNNKLLEVDRAGNEIYSINRPHDVIMARRMRDGQIVLVNTRRQCIRMDTTGKQLKSFGIQWAWQQTGVDILPNGHVLVPATWMNRVTEYDAEGKTVFDLNAMQPSGAARLKNGNILISPQQWPSKVIEMDTSGKQVSSFDVPNLPLRIRTR